MTYFAQILPCFIAPTTEEKIELHRSYRHRIRRQYHIRHRIDPKVKKRWQKRRRQARQKRLL